MKEELIKLQIESGCDVFFENKPVNRLQKREGSHAIDSSADLSESENLASAATSFESLCSTIKDFDGCKIKKTALKTVIFDGTLNSRIMVIGEAPGASEDEHGIPFCGQSGKLLDNILKSVNLERAKNIFITNTVFWRPPGNRRPTVEEIEICRPFVERIISFQKPELILLVGSTAVESMLKMKDIKMGEIRGKCFSYKNKYLDYKIKAVPIFHPSYLLRQPLQKKVMWFDMLKIFFNR